VICMSTLLLVSLGHLNHDMTRKSGWETVHAYRIFVKKHSSVGIALGYGLDDRGSTVRFLAGAGNFSLHHRIQNGPGAHPASYTMGTRGSFTGVKAAGS
jgi:hypothetical protein